MSNSWQAEENRQDPAPSPEDIANERMSSLLASVTNKTLEELTQLRNKIDDLMRAIQSRNKIIEEAFAEHVGFATHTIKCKMIIEETLGKINQNFNTPVAQISSEH